MKLTADHNQAPKKKKKRKSKSRKSSIEKTKSKTDNEELQKKNESLLVDKVFILFPTNNRYSNKKETSEFIFKLSDNSPQSEDSRPAHNPFASAHAYIVKTTEPHSPFSAIQSKS